MLGADIMFLVKRMPLFCLELHTLSLRGKDDCALKIRFLPPPQIFLSAGVGMLWGHHFFKTKAHYNDIVLFNPTLTDIT